MVRILTLLEEKDWSYEAVPMKECCDILEELEPRCVSKQGSLMVKIQADRPAQANISWTYPGDPGAARTIGEGSSDSLISDENLPKNPVDPTSCPDCSAAPRVYLNAPPPTRGGFTAQLTIMGSSFEAFSIELLEWGRTFSDLESKKIICLKVTKMGCRVGHKMN